MGISQPTLFSTSIDERFAKWLKECPGVLDLFISLALEVRRSGKKRYSADALLHRIRWHYQIERRQGDFKCNDHFSSRLARLAMERCPELKGMFELRRLR